MAKKSYKRRMNIYKDVCKYKVTVHMDHHLSLSYLDIENWCYANCSGYWFIHCYKVGNGIIFKYVSFYYKEDALFFKLVWG